jgi:hypothetical protein
MDPMSDEESVQGTDAMDEDETFADDFVDVDIMEASMTAFGSVSCDEFVATQSAMATVAVAGDAEIAGSVIGALSADGVALRQGGACAMLVDGDAAVSQGAAAVIVAQNVELESSGAGILVTGDATLARSWVGFMAARNAEISDDSRVIIDTRAGLIIGALLFGGLGLLAVATYLGARRIADRMPHLPHMPHMPQLPGNMRMPHVGDLHRLAGMPAFADMIAKIRGAA